MKKYFVFISLIYASSLPLNGQTGYILAGQDTGLMYTKFSSPEWMFDLPNYASQSFSIDVDNDGQVDVELKYYVGLNPAHDGIEYMEMVPLHVGVQFAVIYDTVINNLGQKNVYGSTSSYNLNDTLAIQGMNWTDSSVFTYYYNSGGDPISIGSQYAFLGGRIINANDSFFFICT